MPDNTNQPTTSKTLVIDAHEFIYETIDQAHGKATVVKFKLDNPSVQVGDVLLILDGTEIQFHGFIGKIEADYAWAADRASSTLAAGVY
jgi:hypothetical protein